MQGRQLKEVPKEVTDFHITDLPDGNFWEAYDLIKVDLSNN